MGKRRGHGEGAIYQRESDGLWCTSVDLGIINGKRRRKVIYGKTRKEVADKLKALHRDQLLGTNLNAEQLDIGGFLDRWLEQVVAVRNRPRTHGSYSDIARLYLKPHIGKLTLLKLTPEHVQSMLNALSAQGLSPRTVTYIRAVLRKALNQALRWGHIARNVATLVDVPAARRKAIVPLTQAQARALLNAVKGHRLEALYRLTLSLGLRRGEALGLRWQDVDLEHKTLRVVMALQRFKGKLVLDAPKTRSSARQLPLPDVLVSVLRAHRAAQEVERVEAGDAWQEHGLVFPSRTGTPTEPRNLVRHFKGALRAAGLPESTRFHDLRHSCATFLIAQGVHPRVVMEILGHSQIGITMDTYGHVLPETQRDAVDGITELLGPSVGEQPDQAEEKPAPEGDEDMPPEEGGEAPGGEDMPPEEGEEAPPE
jgi:integrase